MRLYQVISDGTLWFGAASKVTRADASPTVRCRNAADWGGHHSVSLSLPQHHLRVSAWGLSQLSSFVVICEGVSTCFPWPRFETHMPKPFIFASDKIRKIHPAPKVIAFGIFFRWMYTLMAPVLINGIIMDTALRSVFVFTSVFCYHALHHIGDNLEDREQEVGGNNLCRDLNQWTSSFDSFVDSFDWQNLPTFCCHVAWGSIEDPYLPYDPNELPLTGRLGVFS